MGIIKNSTKRYEYTKTWTRKSGEVVTRTYTKKAMRSPLLFNRRGNKYTLNEKNWESFLDKIRSEKDLSPMEKTTMVAEAMRIKNDILKGYSIYSSDLQHGYNRIDEASMLSRISGDKTKRFVINLGYDPEDLIKELNQTIRNKFKKEIEVDKTMTEDEVKDLYITEMDLMDLANWKDKTLTVNGISWLFAFKYNGSAYSLL